MIVAQLVHFHMVVSPFRTLQVLLHRGLVSWTQPNSGIITPEEIKRENGREIEIEKGIVTATGKESVPGTGSESANTAPLLVCSTVMKSGIGTENMRKEATSGIERAGRKRNGTVKGDIVKRKRHDTSHLEVTVGAAMTVKKETVTGGTNTKNPKRAKKEKKRAVESLPRNRRTLTLALQNRHV